jgi:hypothetical protein
MLLSLSLVEEAELFPQRAISCGLVTAKLPAEKS